MFREASAFDQPIGGWRVNKVRDMEKMFRDASVFNNNIGAWKTSLVTNMGDMFQFAAAFNQPIGDWSVGAVTNMRDMFEEASNFNQDISGWSVESVEDMEQMFWGASAFDQDLGWCVDDDVSLEKAFEAAPCESTSCGVNWAAAVSCGGSGPGKLDDSTIRTAVTAWLWNLVAAEAAYGHISTWETGGVTDM